MRAGIWLPRILLALWSLAGYLTSLSLSFMDSYMGITNPTLKEYWEINEAAE